MHFFPLLVFRSLYPVLRHHHGGLRLVLLHSDSDCRAHCRAAAAQHRLGQRWAEAWGKRQPNAGCNRAVHERGICGGQHWLKKWQRFKTELLFYCQSFLQILIWRTVLLPRRMSCCAGFNALDRLFKARSSISETVLIYPCRKPGPFEEDRVIFMWSLWEARDCYF